jgi:hypothetical protein
MMVERSVPGHREERKTTVLSRQSELGMRNPASLRRLLRIAFQFPEKSSQILPARSDGSSRRLTLETAVPPGGLQAGNGRGRVS